MDGVNGSRSVQGAASVEKSVSQTEKSVERLVDTSGKFADNLERAKAASDSMGGTPGAPGGTAVGSGKSSLTTPNPARTYTGNTFINSGGASGGYVPIQGSPSSTTANLPKEPGFVGTKEGGRIIDVVGGAFKLLGKLGMYASMLLPSTNEALRLNLLGERYRFYGGAGTVGGGLTGPTGNLSKGSYYAMQQAGRYGTPVDSMDAAFASNIGAGMGLLPGLKNYGTGERFSGIMGGAALVSNLVPGSGLQGGMTAMAGLNQARNVNMLRMIGINVRNNGGTGMRDLPDIIDQLYKILKQSAGQDPTPEMIAVSAMSGNALDSLLSQFFGNDENLRQSVIAALIQMSRSKGTSIGVSGSKENLMKTGGISQSVISLANRNTSEAGLKMATSAGVLKGANIANATISGISNFMTSLANGSGVGGRASATAAQGGAALTGFINTLLGMGGGQLSDSIMSDLAYGTTGGAGSSLVESFTSSKFGKNTVALGKVLGALGLAGGGIALGNDISKTPYNTGYESYDFNMFGAKVGANNYEYSGSPSLMGSVTPSNLSGMTLRGNGSQGGITVNVYGTKTADIKGAVQQALDVALSAAGVSN